MRGFLELKSVMCLGLVAKYKTFLENVRFRQVVRNVVVMRCDSSQLGVADSSLSFGKFSESATEKMLTKLINYLSSPASFSGFAFLLLI
jgi:hypothetical protein